MYKWAFSASYYGKVYNYTIKASNKQDAIEKGYAKLRKATGENNCAFNFKHCNLIH